PSIYRYYEIVPSLNNNLDAVLRFHYLDEELHGHIEDDLTQWRTEDDMNWIEAGKSSGDISANYVELTQIASFAKHSLRPSGVLPLAWGQVAASCVAGNVLLSWQTLQEQNNSHFLIQESESGQLWNLVAKLDA